MSRTPTRTQVLAGPAAAVADISDITSSAEFREYLLAQKTAAERRRDDDTETITRLTLDADRLREDYNTALTRVETEVRQVEAHRADMDRIIAGAEHALVIDLPTATPSPQLAVSPNVVADAINQTAGENAATGE